MTLGERGALYVGRDSTRLFPSYRVTVVDSTGAGDAFNGALAFGLAAGLRVEAAIPFSNAVAAISVTRPGAQASMPSMAEVKRFLKSQHAAGSRGTRWRANRLDFPEC